MRKYRVVSVIVDVCESGSVKVASNAYTTYEGALIDAVHAKVEYQTVDYVPENLRRAMALVDMGERTVREWGFWHEAGLLYTTKVNGVGYKYTKQGSTSRTYRLLNICTEDLPHPLKIDLERQLNAAEGLVKSGRA